MTQAERISQAIEQMNSEREQQAASATKSLITQIMSYNAQIKSLTASREKAKSDLAAITFEPVNAAEIVA